ncbi:hypothetical protein ABZP36_003689 [Zizania latifolia]
MVLWMAGLEAVAESKSESLWGLSVRLVVGIIQSKDLLVVANASYQLGVMSCTPSGNLRSKMALSSVFRKVNVKELISNVSVYSSTTESSGGMSLVFKRWATKKCAGSTKNGRDSNPKYLGVKKFGGEKVEPGNIIVRQRGTRFHPGNYVGMGKDHTLFCLKEGHVRFEHNKLTGRKWIHVDPVAGHELHPVYSSDSTTAAEMEPM